MKNLTEGVDRRLILGPKFQELIEMQMKLGPQESSYSIECDHF